jgi:hypothetical protein
VTDCSKKLRTVIRSNAVQGKSHGSVPYGYVLDEKDKSIYRIDEEVADNVREIFKRVVGGEGPAAIAKDFNARGIITSTDHRNKRNGKNITGAKWYTHCVQTILKNPSYMGTFVAQVKTTPSYKNHKQITRPEDEWVIIENHHPPLIDKETFEIVKALSDSRPKPNKNIRPRVATCGLVKCADCGANMRQQNNGRRLYGYFICQTYSIGKRKWEDNCTRHSIRCDALEKIVLTKIQETVADAKMDKKAFAERIYKASNKETEKMLKSKSAELTKTERRITELDKIISKIYEDNISGKLSDERFNKMLAGYEAEQAGLSTTADTLKIEVESIKAKTANVDSFFKLVERYGEITELTPEIARTFIQKIVVHEAERTTDFLKQTVSQRIDIYFNHIGQYNTE